MSTKPETARPEVSAEAQAFRVAAAKGEFMLVPGQKARASSGENSE